MNGVALGAGVLIARYFGAKDWESLEKAIHTTVALGRAILGKPRDAQDAADMLRQLSGDTHRVLTAVAVQQGDWRGEAMSESRVRFAVLSDEDIRAYIDSGEWEGKAGAYAIQGEGAALVDHYDGSLDTIIGLPATRLIKEFPDLVNAEAAEC